MNLVVSRDSDYLYVGGGSNNASKCEDLEWILIFLRDVHFLGKKFDDFFFFFQISRFAIENSVDI